MAVLLAVLIMGISTFLTVNGQGGIVLVSPTFPPEIEEKNIQPPPRNTIGLWANNNGEVFENSELKLLCEVAGPPPAQIVWMRTVAGETSKTRLDEKDAEFALYSAKINHMKPEFAGTYYCIALNKDGGTTQAMINITVLERPRAHVHRAEVNAGIGDRALFHCTARGDPAPSITWFIGNVPVTAKHNHFFISTVGRHSNLTVVPVGDKDFATYTCRVQNSYGIHTMSVELVQRPVIDDVNVEGSKLSFRVHSHLELKEVEIQLMDQEGNMKKVELPVPKPEGKSYGFTHEFKDIRVGQYQAFIRARNDKDSSRNLDPVALDIEYQPNRGHFNGPSSKLLFSAFIYLLLRMCVRGNF